MQSKIFPFLLAALCATSFSHLHAQATDGKKRELGIGLGGLNFDGSTAFNAFYKEEVKENVYRRIEFFVSELRFQNIDGRNATNVNVGFSTGREKRKTLDRKLQFLSGPVFSINGGYAAGDLVESRVNVNLGAGLALGLQHSFNDLWAINLQTVPSLYLAYSAGEFSRDVYFSIGFYVSSRVSLGIVRKF